MAGNVSEWVADWHGRAYYSRSPGRNPPGPESGVKRVMRGGAWDRPLDRVRSAWRYRREPTFRNFNLGFRCASDSE